MNKRTLMLSAAAVALLSTPALAVGPTTLTTVVTTAQKTSVTGDLTINSGAGINFKSATVPLLTIDSSNTVTNAGTLTGSGQDTQTAVLIDTTSASLTGSFTNNGIIDLSGSGATKYAFHLTGIAANAFTGSIILDTGTVSVVGDNSVGILADSTTTMNGDLLLGANFGVSAGTANGATASGVALAKLFGTINGNVVIEAGASYTATGNAAQGFVIGGPINACNAVAIPGCVETGSFANSGTIGVSGVATRAVTGANAESGSAVIIGSSVAGGVLNNGPSVVGDPTPIAVISANGAGGAAAFSIAPLVSGVGINIGILGAGDANGSYGVVNRGTIAATPIDANQNVLLFDIAGTATGMVNIAGGFFNSGTMTAQATSTDVAAGAAVNAVGLQIDSYVTVPELRFSGQNVSGSGTAGALAVVINGPKGGSVAGILITGVPTDGAGGSALVTHVPKITIDSGARILVSASVTDPTSTAVTTLSAVAIRDVSNSLATLNNGGSISATVSTLTNGLTGVAHAVDVSLNTQALNFTNTGLVQGDVLFGSGGGDVYLIQGTSAAPASHTGAINFGFSSGGGGVDTLHVAQFANVAGAITAQGTLDVLVDGTGTLTVQNVGSTLATRDFTVAAGTTTSNSGTVNITVSQASGIPVITASHLATLGANANLSVKYGSFITAGGSFTLISAPTGGLIVSPSDVLRYNNAIGGAGNLPFLFFSAGVQFVPNVSGQDILRLSVVPKTVAQLGLTGYGARLFDLANTAVAQDPTLGAAIIAGVNSQEQAQATYDSFAPDLSGGARSIAISLTDQASGVVAARQRALRLFGKQAGDLTLWGNEFGEYISTKGGTVTQPGTAITSLEPGFKDHGFGFSVGLDEGAANTGWYGAAFTFYTGDIAEGGDRTSKTSTLWYMLTGYSDWRGKGLFVDTQITAGYGNFKGKRFLDLTIPVSGSTVGTTFSREADSKRAGLLGALGVTMGAIMRYGSTTVIPQISLDGVSLREEGYTEVNGGTGFNLTVKPYYANSLRVFLGSEFREDLNMGDFFLQPSVRIGYRYDLLNDPVKLHAAFADINPNLANDQPGADFTLQGPDPARGNYVAGLNLAATTENWTIGLNYDFVRGSNNATEQVGTISLLGRI